MEFELVLFVAKISVERDIYVCVCEKIINDGTALDVCEPSYRYHPGMIISRCQHALKSFFFIYDGNTPFFFFFNL